MIALLCMVVLSAKMRFSAASNGSDLGLSVRLELLLQQANILESGTALSLGVAFPDNTIALTAGKSAWSAVMPNPSPRVRSRDTFAMGSTAKMYTAASILRLVDAGKFALDDNALPLMDTFWMKMNGTSLLSIIGPQMSNVTVRHLLGMRSGIPDFDTDDSRRYQLNHPHEDLGPVEELSFLTPGKSFNCEPGTCGEYSSTNYELLGLILAQDAGVDSWDAYSQVSGLPEDLMSSMLHTSFALHGPCAKYTKVHAYTKQHLTHNPYQAEWVDVYNFSCTNGWTCGNLMSTGADAARFVRALLGDGERVLSAALQKEMLITQPFSRGWSKGLPYGLGLMDFSGLVHEIPGSFVGHGGDTYGFNAFTAYSLEHDFAISIVANNENLKAMAALAKQVYKEVLPATRKPSTVLV
jgi:CubicO group peptidase (beta-lactamase class C family)